MFFGALGGFFDLREPLWSLLVSARVGFRDAAKISEEFKAFWTRPAGHPGTQPGPARLHKIAKRALFV